jgi:hypothetical protein
MHRLARAFATAGKAEVSDEGKLERALSDAWSRARAAYGQVEVDDERFARYIAEHVTGDPVP